MGKGFDGSRRSYITREIEVRRDRRYAQHGGRDVRARRLAAERPLLDLEAMAIRLKCGQQVPLGGGRGKGWRR
jgi:hypothetical protein